MLFNSYIFIFCFLPITLLFYFVFLKKSKPIFAKIFLVLSSFFFYGYWNIIYVPILFGSIICNYLLGKKIIQHMCREKREGGGVWLIIGIILNLGLLGFFKYTDFLITNFNILSHSKIPLLHITLPLAISFFTFQQIAYLCDCHKHRQVYGFLDYVLFVVFFPQLIAGPIVHHKEMMPQFESVFKKKQNIIDWRKFTSGLFIFFIGLFKKVVIADSFAVYANNGFDAVKNGIHLNFLESWVTSLSYTFQLYFDFSGYCDMAIGIALLFGIMLPINFNSPYKASNIKDFWKRWHMTLGRFLTEYLYIPLGGNKKGFFRELVHIFIVFVLSGIWHGAGWGFIVWGILHGIAMVVHRMYRRVLKVVFGIAEIKNTFYAIVCWLLTFNFINITWVFFRADTIEVAFDMLRGMMGQHEIALPIILLNWCKKLEIQNLFTFYPNPFFNVSGIFTDTIVMLISLIIAFFIILFFKNSTKLFHSSSKILIIMVSFGFWYSLIKMYAKPLQEFLYFNF